MKKRKKIFILAGEASGDALAGWYVDSLYAKNNRIEIQGIGGKALEKKGVSLYKRLDELNVTGVVEIIRHIPRLLSIMNQLIDYLINAKFDELVVIDFPGFNLALIKRLKKRTPQILITYLSPPQLWCWGGWRIHKLKRYTDRIIVLYPFEKKWYGERGVVVEWLATPVYEQLKPYIKKSYDKKNMIAVVPGSRASEVERFMPLFARVIKDLAHSYSELQFVIPCATTFSLKEMKQLACQAGLEQMLHRICFVQDDEKKYQLLAQCCCALTKPGTVSLELALLNVPGVIAFKISWLTYFIARPFVRVSFMGLPNLFLGKEIYKEFIQNECDNIRLAQAMEKLYASFRANTVFYQKISAQLKEVVSLFQEAK